MSAARNNRKGGIWLTRSQQGAYAVASLHAARAARRKTEFRHHNWDLARFWRMAEKRNLLKTLEEKVILYQTRPHQVWDRDYSGKVIACYFHFTVIQPEALPANLREEYNRFKCIKLRSHHLSSLININK